MVAMASSRRPDVASSRRLDVDDAPTICVRTAPGALAPILPPLFAMVVAPGAPPRPFALSREWVSIGGPNDYSPVGVDPGQIVLRPQGEQVFLECSPASSGVRLGGATVYRAILRAGDRFEVGRVAIVIATRPELSRET